MTPPTFDKSSLGALRERVAYEIWLLEEAYHISSGELFPKWPDGVIYPINGDSKFIAWASANIRIGDWRPAFLKVGAPLVFVTAFKLLDMLIEWTLAENGETTNFRFQQKVAGLTPSLQFPAVIDTRPWWRERLIGLYTILEPLRGTIIHERHFATDSGDLVVASSRQGRVGDPVHISATELRLLARCVVSTMRYVDGSWTMDHHRERALRYDLDRIQPLHGRSSMGQKCPQHLTVRVFSRNPDPRTADTVGIARDLAERYADYDSIFDLRFLFVEDGRVARAYLFDWDSIDKATIAALDPARFLIDIPDDVDPEHCR